MDEEKDIELIERYLKDELSESEKSDIELRLSEDEGLQKVYHEMKDIASAFTNKGRDALKKELEELESTLDKIQVESGRFYKNVYFKVAASLTLLAVISYLIFNPSGYSSDDLFNEYYSTYPNIIQPTQRSEDSVNNQDFKTLGYRYYDQKKYEESILNFKKVEFPDAGVYFYMASAQLETGDGSSAADNFKKCIESSDDLDIPAEWYLAMAYLKAQDLTKAKDQLVIVVRRNNSYSAKAADLLNKLN